MYECLCVRVCVFVCVLTHARVGVCVHVCKSTVCKHMMCVYVCVYVRVCTCKSIIDWDALHLQLSAARARLVDLWITMDFHSDPMETRLVGGDVFTLNATGQLCALVSRQR